jgi:tetratricopeptide (TPR) repeat protein
LIQFDQITNNSANMWVIWDKTAVPVEIKVETEKAVQASIDRVMAGPSAGDYFSAASYYLSEDKELDKALTWINKSIEMGNERYWVLRAKSLIQSKLGDKAGAISSAKKSLELAKEAGNMDYVKMNEDSIKEWMM